MHGRAGATADARGRCAGLRRRRPGRHDGCLRPWPDPPRPGGARPTPGAGPPACSWSPRTRSTGAAAMPGPSSPLSLDHLADVEGVTLFELHTSPEAAPLYRELGFSGNPALMRMTRHRPPAGLAPGAQPDSAWCRRSSTPTHCPGRPRSYASTSPTRTTTAPAALRLLPRAPLAHDRRRDGSGRAALGRGGARVPGRDRHDRRGPAPAAGHRVRAAPGQRPYSTLQLVFDGGRLPMHRSGVSPSTRASTTRPAFCLWPSGRR